MVGLILHIGSHKTATTSIQHFCTKNAQTLYEEGFYYPSPPQSAYTHNYFAANLVFDRVEDTRNYLEKARVKAHKNGNHSVVLSGESFFAMTCFFLDFYNRPHDGYFKNETSYINALKGITENFTSIKIICYLRSQDGFAGSLYNQLVKATHGTTLTYKECIQKIKHCFDYEGHLKLWGDAFGHDTVMAFNFDAHKKDILKHFCENVLTPTCYKKAEDKEFLSNTRLNRDVLETKRIFNYVEPDPALAYVSARVFKNLNDNYPDKKDWQVFAPLSFQTKFFSQFEKGNKTLSKSHKHKQIPVLKVKREPTYEVLSDGTRDKIMDDAYKNLKSPLHRCEIGARRLMHTLIKTSPLTQRPVQILRKVVYSLRLKIKGW